LFCFLDFIKYEKKRITLKGMLINNLNQLLVSNFLKYQKYQKNELTKSTTDREDNNVIVCLKIK
jgi:hypothetical protein